MHLYRCQGKGAVVLKGFRKNSLFGEGYVFYFSDRYVII